MEAVTKTKPKPKVEYPVRMDQPFYTLRQAWILKGCLCPWESFCRYRYIQPLGGLYEGYDGGKGVFSNETVMEWLPLLDEDMEVYNRKYKTGAKARSKIKKGSWKKDEIAIARSVTNSGKQSKKFA